ncbi:lysine N(6)-hydroxylase/L-ornithine N(5)-oxygenase family protein [Agrobacterium tumefaciens]|uniref:lysine N(6)-hydroxylase/L-ornithine N(5)-oxygenase family protein n=1 Tax=Agrobacterium tumefaciens TaxID=358 RepID=UPI000975E65E|nr:hypothetical protein BV900_22265 [Agrobacterium tumefaciens]
MLRHDNHKVIAVGAGPANLSLAALAAPLPEISLQVLDKAKALNWHSGLLIEGARMQTSPLKDLVTLVDPTSEYSFLSYLKEKRKLYQAIVRGLDYITRAEFEDYLRWATRRLPAVRFDEDVRAVELRDGLFQVETNNQRYRANTVVLGVGRAPFIPDWATSLSSDQLYHSSELLAHKRDFGGKRVIVVGGGQSGAEIFYHLLKGQGGLPASLCWVTRRANIFALEDSSFVNEWFFPQYAGCFFEQNEFVRKRILEQQTLASDGASVATLRAIYDALYDRGIRPDGYPPHIDIFVNTTADALVGADPFNLSLQNLLTGEGWQQTADVIILATGYRTEIPPFLEPIASRLQYTQTAGYQEVTLRRDFSAYFDGPDNCHLYVQNGARSQHGIADPNLSLLAWRAATVVNSILGRSAYDCGPATSAIRWTMLSPLNQVEATAARAAHTIRTEAP